MVFGIMAAGFGYVRYHEGDQALARVLASDTAAQYRATGFLGLMLGVILIAVGVILLFKRS